MEAASLLSKITSIKDALDELRLHVGVKDLSIGSERFNAQLIFCMANACLRNRAVLLYGGMGANKTTLVNILGSAFMNMSFDDVENLMVSGHPEQTEEKIIGFIDPRQWMQPSGTEIRVLWTPWARSRWKLINEINRFPAGKQNLFLEIIKKRKLTYAGQVLEPGDTCYFATMNPEFSSTYPVDEALMDRISACVPAIQPGLLAGLNLAERTEEVRDLAEQLPRFSRDEFDALPRAVDEIMLDPLTELCIVSLVRDFTLCERAPCFDKTQLSGRNPNHGLCTGCHYFNNPEVCCWQIDEGLSDRVRQDLRSFTKAVSFVSGLKKDNKIEVLRAVAPYVIWHRVTPNRSMLERPPYYGTRRLEYISDLVQKSIDRTVNERGEMNMIFSRAIDGEISFDRAIKELSEYDDPIARLDYIPMLERMA
ncbi:MAG: AAA family ATPase [Methanothrix sp.]|uniref:AAA family ATPase n=1 Tax=Methanothrix sp. TaxID=90426 RepID=UPI0025ED32D1|nr:AAA family ATPase [Methanothrix sp.]MCQ8902793.1 AAA family ATPase [Methanothrix sp.]